MTFSKQFSLLPLLASSLLGAAGCGNQTSPVEPPPTIASAPVLAYDGFAGPDRVLYDAERDRYLVSNVNGDAQAADGNGFISVLSPDGAIENLKWLEGGRDGALLDAPKGLAVADGVLYVADITTVRLFDAEAGSYLGEIAVPGSTFLNGVSVDAQGSVYVSDSGPPQGTLDARGTEAVYRIHHQSASKVADGTLGRPTSITWTPAGLFVAPFGDQVLYRLDPQGNKHEATRLPAQGLAGVVQRGEWLFVSSWQASAIFRGKPGQRFEVALGEQSSPTDLGYDSVRSRLVIPHYTEDRVDVFDVH